MSTRVLCSMASRSTVSVTTPGPSKVHQLLTFDTLPVRGKSSPGRRVSRVQQRVQTALHNGLTAVCFEFLLAGRLTPLSCSGFQTSMIEQSRPSPQLEAHPARDSILWSPVRLHGPLRQRAAACTDNLRIGRALGPNKLAKRSPRPTGPWLVRPRSLTLQPCSSVTRRAPVGHAVAVRLPAFEDEAVPPTAGARRQGGPPVERQRF